MKRLLILVLLISSFQLSAQSASELTNHYEAYYKQMKTQGDVQGIISALTHLNILEPSEVHLLTDCVGFHFCFLRLEESLYFL